MQGPTTLEAVKASLGIEAGDTREDTRLDGIVAAVNSVVGTLPAAAEGGETEWTDAVVAGATMLGARLFRRKNSPAGVETFGAEGAFYVSRNDPDIAMLLGLGAWAVPSVG